MQAAENEEDQKVYTILGGPQHTLEYGQLPMPFNFLTYHPSVFSVPDEKFYHPFVYSLPSGPSKMDCTSPLKESVGPLRRTVRKERATPYSPAPPKVIPSLNSNGSQTKSVCHPKVSLVNSQLFKTFHRLGNEMLVVNDGRVLFPSPRYAVTGLIPGKNYTFAIKLRPLNNHLFKYTKGEWAATRNAATDPENDTNNVDSVRILSGHLWMQGGLTFKNLKIYNVGSENKKKKHRGGVTLKANTETMLKVQPLAKYVPVLTMYEVIDTGVRQPIDEFIFDETEFVVVTKYKNPEVTALKKLNNGFVRLDYKKKTLDSAAAEIPEESEEPEEPKV